MRPALLKRAQDAGAPVRKAELRAQAVLKGALALASVWPLREGEPAQMALERRPILPQAVRFVERDALPLAQAVRLPVLAPAHAAIAGFHRADEPCQVIVGPRQARQGGPGEQVGRHPREHADEMRQAVGIRWWQLARAARYALAPGREGLFLGPLVPLQAEQRVGLEQPRLPCAQTRQVGGKWRTQAENRAQAGQAIGAPVGNASPFFAPAAVSAVSARWAKLCVTSPRASSIATAPKRNGCRPSRVLSA